MVERKRDEGACPLDDEQLKEGEAWIRSLARSLVRSEADLDDLVQETLLIAMQSPPSHQGALKGWFRKVVRNQVYFRFRTDTRRKSREKWVARSTVVANDTTEDLERNELRSNVRGAVSTLREPYRTTLVLHYFHRQTTAQIATQMRVSDSAVRMRLSRSYSQLKDKLEGYSNQNRNAVMLGLAGLAGMDLPADAGAAASTSGWVGGIGRHVGAIAAAVVLVTVASLFWFGSHDGDSNPERGDRLASHTGGNSDAGDDGGTLGRVPGGRDTLLASGVASPELVALKRASYRSEEDAEALDARLAPLEYADTDARVSLRVLTPSTGDGDAEPLADAGVFLGRSEFDGGPLEKSTFVGKTDGEGRIEVPRERLQRELLQVIAVGHVEYRENVRWRALGDAPYDIVLDHEFPATVRVRGPDGDPIAGAEVVVIGQIGAVDQGATAEDGSFEFLWREFSPWIEVHVPGHAAARVRATAPVTLVELERGLELAGTVSDPHGEPVADCTVRIETASWSGAELECRTDARGRFLTPRISEREDVTLRVDRPGSMGPAVTVAAEELRQGATVSIELAPGALLTGVVWGPDRQLVDRGSATLLARDGEEWREHVRVDVDPDGRFRFDPVAEGEYSLWIEHPLHSSELASLGVLADGSNSSIDVTLGAGAEVSGRVVDESDRGVPGVLVRLSHPQGTLPFSSQQFTDSRGEFHFVGVPTHAPEVSVRQDGQFHLLSRSIGTDPHTDSELVLEIGKPFNLIEKRGEEPNEWLGLYGSDNTTRAFPGEDGIELVLADEPGDPLLRFRVTDRSGRTVRTPVYLLAISPQGWASSIDTDMSGIPLNLYDPTALEGTLVWMMADGYAWQCRPWETIAGTVDAAHEIHFVAAPRRSSPVEIRVQNAAGAPLANRPVLVCPDLGDSEAFGGIFLGNTNAAGILETRDLAPGSYKFVVINARKWVRYFRDMLPGYTGFRIARWHHTASIPEESPRGGDDATIVIEMGRR